MDDGSGTEVDPEEEEGGGAEDGKDDFSKLDFPSSTVHKPIAGIESRPILFLVTAFEGKGFQRNVEPHVADGLGIVLAAWQLENCPKTKRVHLHITFVAAARLSSKGLAETLGRLFPSTKVEGKHIRVTTAGSSKQVLIDYCSKPESRLEGTAPCFYNCTHSSERKKPARKMKELEEHVHAADTNSDLASGQLKGTYGHSTSAVVSMHADRLLKREVLLKADRLFAWERAVLSLLLLQPLTSDETEPAVHWFVPKDALEKVEKPFVIRKLDRIARIVRRVLGNKQQSQQTVYYSSDHPKEAFLNRLSCRTKAAFVFSCEECPANPDFLLRLQSNSLGHRSHAGRYDLQELEARHVIVFSHAPPPEMSEYHRKITHVWPVDTNKAVWPHRETLLAHGECTETVRTFVDFDTLSQAGELEFDLDRAAVAEIVLGKRERGRK